MSDKNQGDTPKEPDANETSSDSSPKALVLNPWGQDIVADDDYVRLCEEFGIQLVQDLDIPFSMFEKNRFLRRKIIYGHRDFEVIIKAIQEGKLWAVMSGIKPSGSFHLGTLMVASEIIEFQRMGGKVYYGIADIEAFVDNGISLEDSYQNAVDNLADILTLGLDPKDSYIWLQSQEPIAKDMPYQAGRHVTSNMMKAIYGERDFALYIAALIQVGDILLPQLKDQIMPTVVPVGIDQEPHIRLVRDLTRHFKKSSVDPKTGKEQSRPLFKPAATYHKMLPGLDDLQKKMSKSRPNSSFNLGDEPKSIRKTIMGAFTGGRRNREEQEKLGGVPEKCMVYKLLQIHFQPDDEKLQDRYIRCRGGMLCGTCKKESAKVILDYIADHNERKKAMIPIAQEILSREA